MLLAEAHLRSDYQRESVALGGGEAMPDAGEN